MRALEHLPVSEAIDDVVAGIEALSRHAALSYADRRAIRGTLGAYRFLQRKHAADGRLLATPVGDREETSCRGN